MIFYFLLQIPLLIFNSLSAFLPLVTELPFGIDPILDDGFGWFLYLTTVFPPLLVMYQAFIWVLGFKLTIKILPILPFVGKIFR